MLKNAFILILLFFMSGCHPEGRMYVEHKELSPNLEWLKEDIKTFNVPISENAIAYDLKIAFRYATGFRFKAANIQIIEESPSGKETYKEMALTVRSRDGKYIGQPGLDIWDSEHLVEKDKQYSETGTYKYTIKHIMPQDKIDYAMEIGLILDKSVSP